MTAEDELNQRQAAEDTRPTDPERHGIPGLDAYIQGQLFAYDRVTGTNESIPVRYNPVTSTLTRAVAEAVAQEQLRRRRASWGAAISDSMAQLAAEPEPYTVPGISGYVYQQPGYYSMPPVPTATVHQQPSVEKLVVDEIEQLLLSNPSIHEAGAYARRIIAIVQHHNP